MTGKTALLLVNTGSPEAPTPEALALYLNEFLSDRHIVDLPPWLWRPILSQIIIPRRKEISAKRYAAIWTSEGSPLLATTKKTAVGLQNILGEDCSVAWATCYGSPFVSQVLRAILAVNPERLLVMPLFAQEATQTRGAVVDLVKKTLKEAGSSHPLTVIAPWFDRPEYIAALAASVRQKQIDLAKTRLIASFHSIPIKKSDTYFHQCETTVRLLEKALDLKPGSVKLAFQSKFGFGHWLEPSLKDVLQQEARQGNRSVAVLCPGFAVDCLETLEEVVVTMKETFSSEGGRHFAYIPALGSGQDALALYAKVVREALEQLKKSASDPK